MPLSSGEQVIDDAEASSIISCFSHKHGGFSQSEPRLDIKMYHYMLRKHVLINNVFKLNTVYYLYFVSVIRKKVDTL